MSRFHLPRSRRDLRAGGTDEALVVLGEACARAAAGDLEARVPALPGEAERPELAAVRQAINALLDTGDAFVREASASLTAASEGRFHRRFLRRGFPGAYARAANVIDTARADLQEQRELTAVREAELVAAREEAEQAGNAKAAFLATMSHEIRTPLNAVIGLTDLVLTTELTEDQRSQLQTINRSGDSLLTLLNDVLDFSKIEAGGLELEHAPFDLHDLVHGVAELLGSQAAAKQLDLLVDIDPGCAQQVVGDAGRLRQVLVNLVSNAVKFTERGEVVVTVVSRALDDERAALLLEVLDTGIGIPLEAQGALFETFRQVDQSTTRNHGGTGLGLAISRRIARAMGGDVTVRSAAGAGSVFSVDVLVQVAEPREPECDAPLEGLHVLLVDDNATNRRILRSQVERFGARCTTAADATAALACLDGGASFDVAVLDLHMPQVDGVELARHLHARVDTAQLPLVLLSSAVLPAGADTEFVARLHKPASPDQLVRALTLATRSEKPQRPDSAAHTRQPAQAVLRVAAEPESPAGQALATATSRHIPGRDGRRSEQQGLRPLPGDGIDADLRGLLRPADEPTRLPLRVLVAEDHPVNQHLMERFLQRLGHHADLVDNGAEAVTAVRGGRYDVVLMDGQMPVMGGVAATRAIRALQRTQPRIIAVTASAFAGDRDAFLAAGADTFLTKPLRLQALAAALDETPDAADVPGVDEVLDLAIVEELRSLGEDTFAELYRGFAGNMRAGARDLARSAERGEQVDRAAHKLKGSSSSYGARVVSELCRRLEELEPGTVAQAEAVAGLEAAAEAAYAAIGTMLADLGVQERARAGLAADGW